MENLTKLAKKWRKDFPLLNTKTAENKPLVYLDSAATSQKPQAVIDCVTNFYEKENANVHRGIYQLSETATAIYEKSRETIAKFIGSQYANQLVLTHGATESINLVAHSYFRDRLKPGDEIIVSIMEHHANIVPWHILAKEKSLKIHYIPMLEDGSLDEKAYEELLNEKTQLVAITHVSNVLGTINDIEKITKMAHAYHAKVLVDGAQACPQIQVDVDKIGCDFYIGSSHKSYAPTGVGFLYAKPDLLESMIPYQTGGSMIETVTTSGSTFMPPPIRFEAGTPPIAETIAWARACEYLSDRDITKRLAYKTLLKDYLLDGLKQFSKITVYGTLHNKIPIAAFTHQDIHAHDMATILDSCGVAIRAGHHCAMPLHQSLGIAATTRASLSFYNNTEDIDALVQGIEKAEAIFYG